MPKTKIITLALIALSFIFFSPAHTQGATAPRSYLYQNIITDITVNPDTTFDVIETQTYSFTGDYHQGWRSIPYRKIDAVTDIVVIDGVTGAPLSYSARQLDKTNPNNWGRYTFFKQNNAMNIEWYYDAQDEDKTWILKYKIHGGLTFNQANDQLYWNIFTDYTVPVENAQAKIKLPQNFSAEQIHYFAYRTGQARDENIIKEFANGIISYHSAGFEPRDAFTIDLDWPRGAVNRSAYLSDFIKMYYGYIGSGLIIILVFLFGLFYWLRQEVWVKGRGVIVAQYEPPKKLPPAIMNVILKENVGMRSLPATIIDLAIRGYVTIEQKDRPSAFANFLNSHKIIKKVIYFLLISAVLYYLVGEFIYKTKGSLANMPAPILIYILALAFIIYGIIARFGLGAKDFVVKKNKDHSNDATLNEYEKEFLDALFYKKDSFSTKEAARAGSTSKGLLYQKIKGVQEKILLEAQTKTSGFEKPPAKEKYQWIIFLSVIFISIFFLKATAYPQWIYPIFFAVAGGIILMAFTRFETRLNQSGRELKEEILGFKLFLHTAERYRLQNLTPDMFQKFLPYAMVFGIEKKWAKAFDGLQMTPPQWYHSTMAGAYVGSSQSFAGSASNFSATTFSASFASSFSSAFSSSGAGGGGAGGGGAGGGGGGGGGGAS